MTDSPTNALLYVKPGCPFCLKVRIFLLEADLLDQVEVREFAEGTEQETVIRAELVRHFDKVSFPTLRLSFGEYLADSDAIIARLASDIDLAGLPTFRAYADGIMPRMMALHRENGELKKRLS